jgi:hypothetical protein
MRRFSLPIIVGPLLLLSAVSAISQTATTTREAVAGPAVATSQPAPDHDSYIQKSREDMALWRARLDKFGSDTQAAAAAAGSDATRDLHSAWAELQTASEQLKTAGADGWTDAKVKYEQASDDLAAAWHGVHPDKA